MTIYRYIKAGKLRAYKIGKEFDCKYSNFQNGKFSRRKYLEVLSEIIDKAEKTSVKIFQELTDSGYQMDCLKSR